MLRRLADDLVLWIFSMAFGVAVFVLKRLRRRRMPAHAQHPQR